MCYEWERVGNEEVCISWGRHSLIVCGKMQEGVVLFEKLELHVPKNVLLSKPAVSITKQETHLGSFAKPRHQIT